MICSFPNWVLLFLLPTELDLPLRNYEVKDRDYLSKAAYDVRPPDKVSKVDAVESVA